MNPDIIDTYFPDVDAIPTSDLRAAHSRVTDYLLRHHSDTDVAPGSVVGDLLVNPMATMVAGLEIAMGRFMSDLDLENVANNVIWNCQFVEGYLGNFAVYDATTLQGSGIVRLLFNTDKTITIPRGIRFVFADDKEVYYLSLPFDGDVRVLASSDVPTPLTNDVRMTAVGPNSYAVDLPVKGNMLTPVVAGDTGKTDITFDELMSVTAVVDFVDGLPPSSLPELARITRMTSYSATPTSRGGINHFIKHAWPETRTVSSLLPGDAEMQRHTDSGPLFLARPAVDIIYRSAADHTLAQIVVNIPLSGERFQGVVKFPDIPTRIGGMHATANRKPPAHTVWVARTHNAALPGVTFGYSADAEFWVSIDPPINEGGIRDVPTFTGEDGTTYGSFTIAYAYDPLLGPVSRHMSSGDNAPIGVDTHVQAGPIAVIDRMDIYYEKQPGVTAIFDTAKIEITDYVNGVGWPTVMSAAELATKMKYSGATYVRDITLEGQITYVASDRVMFVGKDFDTLDMAAIDMRAPDQSLEDYEAAIALVLDTVSFVAPTSDLATMADLLPNVVVSNTVDADTGTTDTHAATTKNIRYFITKENIHMREIN